MISNKLGIIHISDVTKFGGIETLVNQLSRYQSKYQGLNVGILSPFKPNNSIKNDKKNRIDIHFGMLNSGFDFRIGKLVKIFKIFKKYDLIHFHGFNIFLILCAKFARKKIVYTEHGTFQKVNQSLNWRKFINSKILGYKVINKYVDHVIFNSKWLMENVSYKNKNISVILNGADPTFFTDQINKNYNSGRFNIMVAARFVQRKRIDRLINAFALLKNQEEYFLHLIGDGILMPKLVQQAKEMLCEGNYSFYGYQSNMSKYYKMADLFVLPTEFEPFGLVVLEAMYAKIPVICFEDGGGALEIIDGVHSDLIVKDEQDLAVKIEYWKEHPDERKLIGDQLFRKAANNFTVERMANKYLKVYQDVLVRKL